GVGPRDHQNGAGARLRRRRPAGPRTGARWLIDRSGAVAIENGGERAVGRKLGEGPVDGALEGNVTLPEAKDQMIAGEFGGSPGTGPAVLGSKVRGQHRLGYPSVERAAGNACDQVLDIRDHACRSALGTEQTRKPDAVEARDERERADVQAFKRG